MDIAEILPSSRKGPVLVVGAASVDLVGHIKGDLTPGSSTPSHIRSSFGGVARNVAENLARLGHPVTILTAVGADSAGEALTEQLAEAGVDTHSILHLPGRSTGTYLAVVDNKGELRFALDDMRTAAAITPQYLESQTDLFKHAALLFLDANLPKETIRKAAAMARRARLPVCADPTSVELAERFLPYLSRLYLITPNHAEASVLCGQTIEPARPRQAIDAAKCLVSQGVRITIITLAQFGVCYASSETTGYIPALGTKIIDPTGAGDALTAAVIYGLLNEIPLDDAVRLGVTAATLTLRHPGAVLPDLTLEKLYDQLVI